MEVATITMKNELWGREERGEKVHDVDEARNRRGEVGISAYDAGSEWSEKESKSLWELQKERQCLGKFKERGSEAE